MDKYVKIAETHAIPKNTMQIFKVEDHESSSHSRIDALTWAVHCN